MATEYLKMRGGKLEQQGDYEEKSANERVSTHLMKIPNIVNRSSTLYTLATHDSRVWKTTDYLPSGLMVRAARTANANTGNSGSAAKEIMLRLSVLVPEDGDVSTIKGLTHDKLYLT